MYFGLAAVTAGMVGAGATNRSPIAAGAGAAFIRTLITWHIAVSLIDDLTGRLSARALQAATGLVAVLVLLVVMNRVSIECTGPAGFRCTPERNKPTAGGGTERVMDMALIPRTRIARLYLVLP
jgi:hypothetical protein